MKRNYFFGLLLVGLINSFILNAQPDVRCGTVAVLDTVSIHDGDPTEGLPQINRTLSVSVFVVKNSDGSTGIDTASIYNAISVLNQYFTPIALSFRICSAIHYVANYNFNELCHENTNNINYPLTAKDLVTLNFVKNTINIYFVSSLRDPNFSWIDGYTYMPGHPGKDYIFLRKDAVGGSNSNLAHQIGHYFNLYHTYETGFGAEKVTRGAGANCSTAGDFCCDTEAAPASTLISNCIYAGDARDSNNELYSPSVKNVMSLSPDACRCAFSRTQYLRMKYALEHYRTNLR